MRLRGLIVFNNNTQRIMNNNRIKLPNINKFKKQFKTQIFSF